MSEVNTSNTAESLWICWVCQTSFADMDTRNNHVKTLHLDNWINDTIPRGAVK